MKEKVVLGLSGGVDSAVSARLLTDAGYEVLGLYLDNGLPGAEGARLAAASLGIPLEIRDVRREMEERVCRPFAESYLRGETPNPCILCNPAVKLRALAETADRVGAAYIATGHYAVSRDGALYRGRPENDQSYMLCRITPDQLDRLLLPLGPYRKTEVRALAEKLGLPVAHKPDSMEICFVPGGDYASYIESRGLTPPPGSFILRGEPAGTHRGIHHYTVGQRRHLGASFGRRVYVAEIRPERNEVVLGEGGDVYAGRIRARDMHWLVPEPAEPFEALVRVRHSRSALPRAVVTPRDGGAVIDFAEPVRAPAPGQTAALYDGDRLLGGGFIGRDA